MMIEVGLTVFCSCRLLFRSVYESNFMYNAAVKCDTLRNLLHNEIKQTVLLIN